MTHFELASAVGAVCDRAISRTTGTRNAGEKTRAVIDRTYSRPRFEVGKCGTFGFNKPLTTRRLMKMDQVVGDREET